MSATAAKRTFHFYKKNSSLGPQFDQSYNFRNSNKANTGSRGVSDQEWAREARTGERSGGGAGFASTNRHSLKAARPPPQQTVFSL